MVVVTKQIGVAITLHIYIREVFSSNLGCGTGYTGGFSWVSSIPPGNLLDNNSIRPYSLPFKSFTIHHSSYVRHCITWDAGLRHELFSLSWMVGSWVRISFKSMGVCVWVYSVCVVLCVGSGLETGWSPVQGVLPCKKRLRNWRGQGPIKGCRDIDEWMNEIIWDSDSDIK
jgi:hypothetical protein